jgi:hypothetical protein
MLKNMEETMPVIMSHNQNWNLGNVDTQCAACQVQLSPSTPCWAVLIENSPDTVRENGLPFRRQNYCQTCWHSQSGGGLMAGIFSHWKTSIPEPNRKPKLLVDDHVLVDLFTRLAEQPDAANIRFRFVLALLLMRKRILRYEGSELLPADRRNALNLTDEKAELWRMMLKGQAVEVINPVLTSEQIGDVAEQISTILAETI